MGKTVKVGRALLSVFDKSGMAEFAKDAHFARPARFPQQR